MSKIIVVSGNKFLSRFHSPMGPMNPMGNSGWCWVEDIGRAYHFISNILEEKVLPKDLIFVLKTAEHKLEAKKLDFVISNIT